jgi:hypothetical protein
MEEVITGRWEGGTPCSPHKLLNAYIKCFTNFTPLDGDEAFLSVEPDVEPIETDGFEWKKIEQGATHLLHAENSS